MDTTPEDQATIGVLCMQARLYSEMIARARAEAAHILAGMRKTIAAMADSADPRMRRAAAEVEDLIAATHADLMQALQ